ncbi:MAG: thymidine kinase [Flavobacteriales bacterium]
MFIEPRPSKNQKKGWIEIICGSMFSGKTEELIRRLNRAKIAQLNVLIFKPKIDVRYAEDAVVSHNDTRILSHSIDHSSKLIEASKGMDVIGVDEAQFFDNQLVEACNMLANQGVRVIVAGLDMDFTGKAFAPMPELMAVAEYVTKVHAICLKCGDVAQYSHRIQKDDNLLLLGEKEAYESLCRQCFNRATKSD